MGADLRPLLHEADVELPFRFGGKLRQAAGGGQAGRAAADDHDIELHGLAGFFGHGCSKQNGSRSEYSLGDGGSGRCAATDGVRRRGRELRECWKMSAIVHRKRTSTDESTGPRQAGRGCQHQGSGQAGRHRNRSRQRQDGSQSVLRDRHRGGRAAEGGRCRHRGDRRGGRRGVLPGAAAHLSCARCGSRHPGGGRAGSGAAGDRQAPAGRLRAGNGRASSSSASRASTATTARPGRCSLR